MFYNVKAETIIFFRYPVIYYDFAFVIGMKHKILQKKLKNDVEKNLLHAICMLYVWHIKNWKNATPHHAAIRCGIPEVSDIMRRYSARQNNRPGQIILQHSSGQKKIFCLWIFPKPIRKMPELWALSEFWILHRKKWCCGMNFSWKRQRKAASNSSLRRMSNCLRMALCRLAMHVWF